VLVVGESGVGKEMIARAIHEKSDRADNPLVKVNCASIPKDLFETVSGGPVLPAERPPEGSRDSRLRCAHALCVCFGVSRSDGAVCPALS
jgi:sigma54-dependent transcription regulator